MRRLLSTCLVCALILLPVVAMGQQGVTINGNVTDEEGNPLAGANVFIKGTAYGASANVNGAFSFKVPADAVTGQEVELVAQFMGYKSQTVRLTLSPGTIIQNFTLATDVLKMDEIVVMGMGIEIQKEKLGVTIAKVSPTEIVNSDETNVVEALAGKVSNVEVTSSAGDPGSSVYLRIRGASTVQGDNQPLFVVDGIPIDNQSLIGGDDYGNYQGVNEQNRASDINPEDIESMEILKGAAASAIYGSRAANGVVMITTKKGRPGRTNISYKMTYTFDQVNKTIPLQTKWGQGVNGEDVFYHKAWGPRLDASTPTYNHWDEMFETGHRLENNLSVSGGTELTTYYMSFGTTNHDGTIKGNSDYNRYSARLSGSQRISTSLNLSGTIAYADVSSNRIQKGSNVSGLLLGGLRTPPDFNNLPYLDPVTGFHRSYTNPEPANQSSSGYFDNPFFIIHENLNNSDVGRVFGHVKLEYDPLDWLKLNYTLGRDYYSDERRTVFPISSATYPDGYVVRDKYNFTQTDGSLTITAGKRFEKLNVNVNAVFGHQLNERRLDQFSTYGEGMAVYDFDQLDNTASYTVDEYEQIIRDESYLGQLSVDLFDQLYLQTTMRNDGSSTFGKSQKRHWFPKVSGAWEFTRLSALQSVSRWLDFGKLRCAYGEAGRQPPVYSTVTAFASEYFRPGGWNVEHNATAFGFSGFHTDNTRGNEDIKPQRTKELELGLDLGLVGGRAGLEATYYQSKTVDAILTIPVPYSTGFRYQLENAASIENKGWEIGINLQPISKKNVVWNMRLLYAMNDNEVVDLAGSEYISFGGFSSCNSNAVMGEALGVFRGLDFVRFGRGVRVDIIDENGAVIEENVDIDSRYSDWQAGDLFVNGDGYPSLDPQERVIGDPNPDWTGSIRNSVTLFNKLTISALIDIKQGGDVHNGTRGALYSYGTHKDTENRDTATKVFDGAGPGAGKEVPLDQGWYLSGLGNNFNGPAAQFVEDGSYVKLREIAIAYKLRHPLVTKWTGLSDIDIRLSGRNLHTWTDYTGIDPETNMMGTSVRRGLDYFGNPQTLSYVVTLRFNY